MNEIINIDSVDVYNKQFGLETLHPLVSVIDMNQATRLIGLKRFNYGIYALFLKMEKACNIKSGSGVPNKTKVATITKAQVEEIAKTKMPDLNAATVEAAASMIAGTCRSMGVTVVD